MFTLNEIMNVQPMQAPIGMIYHIPYRYAITKSMLLMQAKEFLTILKEYLQPEINDTMINDGLTSTTIRTNSQELAIIPCADMLKIELWSIGYMGFPNSTGRFYNFYYSDPQLFEKVKELALDVLKTDAK